MHPAQIQMSQYGEQEAVLTFCLQGWGERASVDLR